MGSHFRSSVRAVPAALITFSLVGCSTFESADALPVEYLRAEVKEVLPYNESLFTQGLELTDAGELLVGTGQYGSSGLYRFRPGELVPEESTALDRNLFGEGITQHGEDLWQLTWKEGTAINYDPQTLEEKGRTSYTGEGWGLCSMGKSMYLSDGTSKLRQLDSDFQETGSLTVTLDGKEVSNLNELECVDGDIFANVWMEDDIYRIDSATGDVTAVIDTTGIANNAENDPDNVLNGIAHIRGNEFFLTGKRWPDLYRVAIK